MVMPWPQAHAKKLLEFGVHFAVNFGSSLRGDRARKSGVKNWKNYDITGIEVSACVFCGRPTFGFELAFSCAQTATHGCFINIGPATGDWMQRRS
jgi:hypothetical protein